MDEREERREEWWESFSVWALIACGVVVIGICVGALIFGSLYSLFN